MVRPPTRKHRPQPPAAAAAAAISRSRSSNSNASSIHQVGSFHNNPFTPSWTKYVGDAGSLLDESRSRVVKLDAMVPYMQSRLEVSVRMVTENTEELIRVVHKLKERCSTESAYDHDHVSERMAEIEKEVGNAMKVNSEAFTHIMRALHGPHMEILDALRNTHDSVQEASEVVNYLGEVIHSESSHQNPGSLLKGFKGYSRFKDSVMKDREKLEFVHERLSGSFEALRDAVDANRKAINDSSTQIQHCNRILTLAVVQANGSALEKAPADLKNNREFILDAVRQDDVSALHFASEEVRSDRKFLTTVLDKSGLALQYMPMDMREDPDFVRMAIISNGMALEFASPALREDYDLVKTAVLKSKGGALRIAGSKFQGDRDLVLLAIQEDGLFLSAASETLRGDREVVRTAVQSNGMALRYASEELREDHQMILEAVSSHPMALEFASKKLQRNTEIVLCALHKDGHALQFVSPELRDTRAIVRAAVRRSGMSALKLASQEFQDDVTMKEFAESADDHRRSDQLACEPIDFSTFSSLLRPVFFEMRTATFQESESVPSAILRLGERTRNTARKLSAASPCNNATSSANRAANVRPRVDPTTGKVWSNSVIARFQEKSVC